MDDTRSDDEGNTRPDQRSSDSSPNLKRSRRRVAVPALLTVLPVTLLSVKLVALPINRILESRYCLEYYQAHDPSKIPPNGEVPESDCKLEVIQQRLGWLMGASDTTVQFCDLAMATPMGYLSDKIGRRLVLALNCSSTAVLLLWATFVGGIQSMPPAAILAGPFLALFGGGSNVFKSVSVALMSDMAESDIQRTTYISYFLSTDYVTMLAGPMLAALLMPHGLLLPLWSGFVMIVVAMPLLSLVPARRPGQEADLSSVPSPNLPLHDCEQIPLLYDDEDSTDHVEAQTPPSPTSSSPIRTFFSEDISLLRASPNFRLLLLTKFLSSFSSSSSGILALYITLRTGWTFAEVGYIYTLKGIINIFLAAVVVPACARYFINKDSTKQDSSFTFNLISTKVTLLVSIIGAALVALAATKPTIVAALCIYALGSVLPVFIYAIARSPELGVLNEGNEGSGFTILVVVQAIGALIGAPTMAAVWVQAIRIGGSGLGLPYFVSAVAYAVALGVVLFVKGAGADGVEARRSD